ncbi:MAG: hypothetical protein ACYCZ1_03615 [Candidatus Humimicrobiaceae bacterium]
MDLAISLRFSRGVVSGIAHSGPIISTPHFIAYSTSRLTSSGFYSNS